ncbi:unnamed protein product [Chrysodeixis includens]|uniref:Uncharacterized protein n=1 Tax=Chrysodeixis includens TaxID=689277 RepID=A0A9P0C1Q3_CHRIL|nr:unnamed protein product [Chrysodeixis includens]
MSTFIFTVLVLATASAAPHHSHDKTKAEKHPTCQEFTQGLSFNDSQAVGTWHLLHYKNEPAGGSAAAHCVQITPVNDQERKDLNELIGKYVENLKWESITLKMQIPCPNHKLNKTRDYYLEKLEGDGSYRTLQIPPSTIKLDLSDFNRYPMRLKAIESQYLGMMDCHEKFVFIMGREQPEGKDIDERLKKMIQVYWPEE